MREEILHILSRRLRPLFAELSEERLELEEVRLRAGLPLILVCRERELFLDERGHPAGSASEALRVSAQDIRETLDYVSGHSLYAFEEELRQGFLTVPGGHRVGVAGRVSAGNGSIRGLRNIAFINLRLASQRKGCADRVLPWLFDPRTGEIRNTLVISPPRCGKTTLLRDLIRQLSDGDGGRGGFTVGVADERSELAACYHGVPQNDVGIRTDVLDGCPKAAGMMMLIRSMSPQIVAADEIGSAEEVEAMKYAMNCGVCILATVHGSSLEDVQRKPALAELVRERWFERYVLLRFPERGENVEGVYDAGGRRLFPAEKQGVKPGTCREGGNHAGQRMV